MTSQRPPEAAFMSLDALDRQDRIARSRPRTMRAVEPGDRLQAALGAHPFTPGDGILEPTAWANVPVPSRTWVVKNLIPTGEVTMITGNGGEGKSLITMQLLIAAATGTNWLGNRLQPVRCLGVYCEDDGNELHRRTSSILGGEGMDYSHLDGLTLVCRKGKDNVLFDAQFNDMTGDFTALFQRLRQTAIQLGAQIIILDSLYDFFGGNENSKTQVKQFINGLAELAMEINGSIIIVAHPSLSGMGSGSGTAGSTAWHNSVRSRLYLHRQKPPQWEIEKNPHAKGPLILQPMKSNYGPPELAIELMWEAGRFIPVIDPTMNTALARGALFGDAL